jgi:O-antigen ligase
MLVCSLPLAIVAASGMNNKSRRWLTFILLVLILPALFFSYARGAWLALCIGLAAWWLLRRGSLFYGFMIGVFLAIAAVSWLSTDNRYLKYAHHYNTTVFHPDFREHLRATYELRDISAAERYYRWIAAVRMAREEPVTGFGPGTFYHNYQSYTVPAFKTWVSSNPERSTAHNYFLLTVSEQGLPGLLCFLLVLGAATWYAQRLYSRSADPFSRLLAAAAGVMLVMIITLNLLSDLVETDKVGSLFFLALSLLVLADQRERVVKKEGSNIAEGEKRI